MKLNIERVGYLVIALLLISSVILVAVVVSKKTVQLEDAEGKVLTGEIKTHLLPKKAA